MPALSASLLRRYLPRPAPSSPARASPPVRGSTAAPRRPQLERVLLRRSVGEREAHRHRCVHCGRTPLTGELVHVYAGAAGEGLVCELCRPLRRESPARSELMHAPDHERSVRVTRRAA